MTKGGHSGVIGTEDDWFRRGVKESIYIRALSPSINENPGRHLLPPNYDPILEKTIKKPAAAAVHDPNLEEILSTAPRRQGRPRKNDSTSSQTIPMEIASVQQQIHQPPQQQQQQPPNQSSHTMVTRRRALIEGRTRGTPD